VIRDLLYLERVEQAETLLKPQRIEVLRQLAEPRSCTEVAARLDQTQQRVYYHVKRLVEQGLVTQVAERRVRGIHEGVYQATARSYWLSPGLVGRIGQRQKRDEASLGYLLDLMEEVQADVAALHGTASHQIAPHPTAHKAAEPHATVPHNAALDTELPSLGVSGEIRVRPERRPEFMADLKAALQDLFMRYGGAEGDAFKLAVACYPARPHHMPHPQEPPHQQSNKRSRHEQSQGEGS
jgi:DNA-binding transcriptional ArsR family regulator